MKRSSEGVVLEGRFQPVLLFDLSGGKRRDLEGQSVRQPDGVFLLALPKKSLYLVALWEPGWPDDEWTTHHPNR
jgi:hypothetical protein